MRIFLYSIAIISFIGSASANRPVSGVVAVSTGPMQAKYTDATREIGRDLVAGDDVFLNDKVETGRKTKAQVMLKDESVFSISPNSKVIFDEFVYDPFTQTGALSARLLDGGVRFVSGNIANRQPQNVVIRAGSATVGIRGTEIVAKHSDEGSTFVLLSGAMEVSTPAGLQTINRHGFGLDVTADGTLGDIRPVPLQEILQLLSPPEPTNADEASAGGDSEEASPEDDNADTAADEETTLDDSGTSETGETSEGDNQSAANTSDAASTEDTSSAETLSESSFDSALVGAAKSDGDGEQPELSSLSDLNLALAAETKTLDEPRFSGENATASIIDALVEDKKDERGTSVAEEIAREQNNRAEPEPRQEPETMPEPRQEPETIPEPVISLALKTSGTLTDNPYFSSDAKLLVRSSPYFQAGDVEQFNITHAIMKEKFPESFDDNDFKYYTRRPNYSDNFGVAEPDLVTDLTPYDAVLIYADWHSNDQLTDAEITEYSRAVQDTENGLKVLLIGRQTTSNSTVNSIMNIFDYTDDQDGKDYEYRSTYYASGNSEDILQPIVDGEGEPVSDLLADVTEFPQYYRNSTFGRFDFNRAEAPNDGDDLVSFDNGLLSSETDNHIVAADFGEQGAAFIGRYACSANGEGNLGMSINANLVNNGREQFCRNLISSIAPNDSLVDVEVGTLSVSGTDETSSYRLVSGGGENFKIIGDRLILDRDASLMAGSYNLTIGVTPTGGDEIEKTISVSIADGDSEKRVISSSSAYNVGDKVSFPTENLVSHNGYLENISWVSIGDISGGGTPTNTGIITLHYRISEGDTTYDRFHEIEINHDCSSDHCKEFATSMDTEDDLDQGQHFEPGEIVSSVFEANDFTPWSSFFDRFTSGTGRFASRQFQSNSPWSSDYHYDLEVNYGDRTGLLEAEGTLSGYNLNDQRWQFDFLQSGGACDGHVCEFADNNDNYDLRVFLANISLPNGKHSLMLRNSEYTSLGEMTTDWEPMTPQ